ncbi:hypothetical protein [Allokutzneria multivorans]|uniref:hypothetical protein n=1 Tax=Allokutzneria multivorans TaxID=1142134 RepID=UPI0031E5F17A
MSFQATVEPLEEPLPETPFLLQFQYRVEDEAGVFRVASQVYDEGLLVLMAHIARFAVAPFPDAEDQSEVNRFVDKSVMPAVFPYIQEGAASAAARVRPKRPLLINWNYNEPLELKRD